MKRIWVIALPVVLWCCLALSLAFITENPVYLVVGIFLPIVLVLLNMARPRRGIQYAYWNRYLAVFGIMLLGLLAVPIITAYVTLKLDVSANVFGLVWLLGWIIWIPGFFLWFKFLFMPVWGPWRLRKRYPKMVATARRLKKLTENYTWYFPLVFARDKPYLVVGYSVQSLTGLATIDEQGCFVKDELLAIRLLRCYKLAMTVVHMPDSHTRAQDIDSYKKTDCQMQQAYRRFRQNEQNFRTAGQPAYDRWRSINEFEPDFHAITEHWIERKIWLAQWAFDQGLNKLTEISDKQLSEVEGKLEQCNATLLTLTTRLDQVGADAEALLKYVQERSIRLEHRSDVNEMLKGLVLLRRGAVAWKKDPTEFLPLPNEWKVWRERKLMAEELERQGKL